MLPCSHATLSSGVISLSHCLYTLYMYHFTTNNEFAGPKKKQHNWSSLEYTPRVRLTSVAFCADIDLYKC